MGSMRDAPRPCRSPGSCCQLLLQPTAWLLSRATSINALRALHVEGRHALPAARCRDCALGSEVLRAHHVELQDCLLYSVRCTEESSPAVAHVLRGGWLSTRPLQLQYHPEKK